MSSYPIPAHDLNTFREELKAYFVFNETEWEAFKPHLEMVNLKKKAHFAINGKICDAIGFIVRGAVRYYHLKDGMEITSYFSFENEFVSSYKSFLKQEPSNSYIQALEDTALITITYQNMQLLLKHDLLGHKTERFGRLVAEHYICCYEDRVQSFIIQSPEERYIHMMKTEREILQRVPQHYIATFLGITPVSLSRIRKRTVLNT